MNHKGITTLSSRTSERPSFSLDNWWTAPFTKNLSRSPLVQNCFTFLWQHPESDNPFLVWYNPVLFQDLSLSDMLDDHEFFPTKQQKRSIEAGVSNMNLLGILSSLHVSPTEVSGSQESNNKAERTQGPQELEKNPERTEGPQEKAVEPQGLQYGDIWFESKGVPIAQVEWLMSRLPGNTSPLGLSAPTAAADSYPVAMESKKKMKLCELFSPPRVTAMIEREGGMTTTTPSSFDLTSGWDFRSFQDRKSFWDTLRNQEPDVVGMSPTCKAFSVLMNSNWDRMTHEEVERVRTEGLCMFQFCVQVAECQMSKGKFFYIEQPGEASSWDLNSVAWLRKQKDVFLILFDQCQAGLSLAPGTVSQKSTGFLSNHGGLIAELSKMQCTQDHDHLQLQGGLPSKAQKYPEQLVTAIIRGLSRTSSFSSQSLVTFEDEEEEEEDDSGFPGEEAAANHVRGLPAPQTPGPVLKKEKETLTPQQKEQLHRLHSNAGHATKQQMLMMLKAAGAKESIMKYVEEEFSCAQCMRQRRPIPHKQVAFPRTFSFNHILGIDFFFISFQGKTHAFLNVVCQGTNFQQVGWLRNYEGGSPSSKAAWFLFESLWIRPFGLPNAVITDQGSEFKHYFERRLEQYGVLQVTCDAAAPWQNGKCERHGSWAKQRVEDDLQSGQATVETSAELDDLMTMMVSFKNKYFHRGGFSPAQLVFGTSPRLPTDFLSDDQLLLPALEELRCDPLSMDTPTADFARASMIREKARQLCIKTTLKDKAQLGMRKHAHRQRVWTPGQWVYCWRKFTGTGGGHTTRARWVGPGLVIQQYHHSVWVAMRSRIWK